MQIIILGANTIGVSLAETLSRERNSITLVDEDHSALEEQSSKLDIRTVVGRPSYPNVLESAGATEATMLLAVTDSDEMNMIACRVAAKLFQTPTRICRVRARPYMKRPELFRHHQGGEEIIIQPEQLVTEAIDRLLHIPEALQVLEFADGSVVLVAVRILKNSLINNKPLKVLKDYLHADIDGRVAALFRQGEAIIPEGTTVVKEGDEAFFIAAKEHIQPLIRALHPSEKRNKRVTIGGGGHIGKRLAQTIEKEYLVRVVESRPERCRVLAETLNHAVVIQDSASDRQALLREDIQRTDVYCALTNNDSVNIMSSILAKNLGARKVITLINDPACVDLVHGDIIDIALSPRQFTVSSILRHVRRGGVAKVHSLRRGAAEAMEIVLHGDAQHSQIIGRTIEELPLPPSTTVGAIIRDSQVIIAHRLTRLKAEDHIIMFVADEQHIPQVEHLFQAEFGSV